MYTVLTGLLTLFSLFLFYLKRRNDYWKNRKVPYKKAKLLVGHMWETLCGRKNAGVVFDELYRTFDDAKYCGIMNFGMPSLLVKDPELLERVLIKDFSKFHDNGFIVDVEKDPVLSKNPFVATGELWKTLRNQIAPQLSPLKIKNMYPLMVEIKENMVNYLKEFSDTKEKAGVDANMLSLKYTNGIVANCAFGVSENYFNDENKSEILELSKNIFTMTIKGFIFSILTAMFPFITVLYIPPALSLDVTNRIKEIMLMTINERREKNIRRGDILDGIMDLKEKSPPGEYTDDHVTAHATTFFLDGTTTSATVLQYILYELGKNKDIQNKLREEFKEALDQNNGEMSHDTLQGIEYLEMVIYETLRIHPPGLFSVKLCTETTTFPPAIEGGSELVIEKGTTVTIPTYSLHKDPKYYENPGEFIPERFSTEAKASRPKLTFLGFGEGPRICIGRKFALASIKVAIFGIITNFEIEINEKTPKKLEIDPMQLFYHTKGGIWLNFHPIN